MHIIVWRYRVAADRAAEFERIYGRDGAWAALFRRAPGYVRTELFRGGDGHLTLDYWADEASFARFQAEHGHAYEELDRQCDALTLAEERIGIIDRGED